MPSLRKSRSLGQPIRDCVRKSGPAPSGVVLGSSLDFMDSSYGMARGEVCMSIFLVDFAVCPCGEQTPVRPSTLVIPNSGPQPLERDSGPIFVACMKCKRVYSFDTHYLLSRQTTMGVGPNNPEAPMTVFQVPIPCGRLNCNSHLRIHAFLKTNTNDAEMKLERALWWLADEAPHCKDHRFQWPF
jgi:hypothetical protein